MSQYQPPPSARHSILPPSARQSRQSNFPSNSQSSQLHHQTSQNTALQSRIASKRAELSSLQSLRDLSAQLASQMSLLEAKLSTLSNGAESVACVLANWENVLGVIGMASSHIPTSPPGSAAQGEEVNDQQHRPSEPELPITLVRIPVRSQDSDSDPVPGGERQANGD